jgi:hypothetical protein
MWADYLREARPRLETTRAQFGMAVIGSARSRRNPSMLLAAISGTETTTREEHCGSLA